MFGSCLIEWQKTGSSKGSLNVNSHLADLSPWTSMATGNASLTGSGIAAHTGDHQDLRYSLNNPFTSLQLFCSMETTLEKGM